MGAGVVGMGAGVVGMGAGVVGTGIGVVGTGPGPGTVGQVTPGMHGSHGTVGSQQARSGQSQAFSFGLKCNNGGQSIGQANGPEHL